MFKKARESISDTSCPSTYASHITWSSVFLQLIMRSVPSASSRYTKRAPVLSVYVFSIKGALAAVASSAAAPATCASTASIAPAAATAVLATAPLSALSASAETLPVAPPGSESSEDASPSVFRDSAKRAPLLLRPWQGMAVIPGVLTSRAYACRSRGLKSRATASATRMPSTAALMMPPAYPAPSPQGYTPAAATLPSLKNAWREPLSRTKRTGLELRVSTAVITALSLANPLIRRSNWGSACSKDCATKSGRHSCRSLHATPRAYVGVTDAQDTCSPLCA